MSDLTAYISKAQLMDLMNTTFPPVEKTRDHPRTNVRGVRGSSLRVEHATSALKPEDTNKILLYTDAELIGTVNHGELEFAARLAGSYTGVISWRVYNYDGLYGNGNPGPVLNVCRGLAYRLGWYHYLLMLPRLDESEGKKLNRELQALNEEIIPLGTLPSASARLYVGLSSGARYEPPVDVVLGTKATDNKAALEIPKVVGAATRAGVPGRRIIELVELGIANVPNNQRPRATAQPSGGRLTFTSDNNDSDDDDSDFDALD